MKTDLTPIWQSNPDLTRLHCFEDGNCFAKLSDANNHKRSTGKPFETIEKFPKEAVELPATDEVSETLEEQDETQQNQKPIKKK